MTFIRSGWASTARQLPVAILLFLYQLLWGVFLYRVVDSAVTAAMKRYPDPAVDQLSRLLFIIEGQMELKNNPDVLLLVGLICGMVLLRLLLTPLIRAGIYHGLLGESGGEGAGWLFFQGIRQRWKPVVLIYFLELVLTLLPGYWLLPRLYNLLPGILQAEQGQLLQAGILLVCWGIWIYLIKQCLVFITLGWLTEQNILPALRLYLHRLPAVISISCILGAIGISALGSFSLMSWVWTGILGLIIQQVYPFVRSMLNIWSLASQYHLWNLSSVKK